MPSSARVLSNVTIAATSSPACASSPAWTERTVGGDEPGGSSTARREPQAEMDFPTRNLYRQARKRLARYSDHDELAVTARVLSATRLPREEQQDEIRRRAAEPGYHV